MLVKQNIFPPHLKVSSGSVEMTENWMFPFTLGFSVASLTCMNLLSLEVDLGMVENH